MGPLDTYFQIKGLSKRSEDVHFYLFLALISLLYEIQSRKFKSNTIDFRRRFKYNILKILIVVQINVESRRA